MTSSPDPSVQSLLRWYAEMGVDTPVGEDAIDRFALSAEEKQAAGSRTGAATPMPSPERADSTMRTPAKPTALPARPADPLLTATPDAVLVAAREQARSASTLQELRDLLERFDGCALKATAMQLVFRDGIEKAPIMFVGEAPGGEEDRRGLPFVGRSGQLLDRILAAVGLDRSKIAIANVVPWRPPGNRTPTPQEIAACKPFIERQIELVEPEILVCLGAPSAQTLLGVTEGILKLRGRWMSYDRGDRSIRAMATLHPAYLLRQPLQKRLAWRDFRAIQAALDVGKAGD